MPLHYSFRFWSTQYSSGLKKDYGWYRRASWLGPPQGIDGQWAKIASSPLSKCIGVQHMPVQLPHPLINWTSASCRHTTPTALGTPIQWSDWARIGPKSVGPFLGMHRPACAAMEDRASRGLKWSPGHQRGWVAGRTEL